MIEIDFRKKRVRVTCEECFQLVLEKSLPDGMTHLDLIDRECTCPNAVMHFLDVFEESVTPKA